MTEVHDIAAIARKLSKEGRGKTLTRFNNCSVGVARFSKHPLWERHPAGDELLQVFEGELDLTLLTRDGPIETTLRPGSVFVVPRGLWHSPRPRGVVTMMFVSDTEGTEVSNRKVSPKV